VASRQAVSDLPFIAGGGHIGPVEKNGGFRPPKMAICMGKMMSKMNMMIDHD
jgi:hypothetical protein